MKEYQVDFYDPENGATSPIDTIEASEDYTAEDYVKNCEENADDDWVEMLHRGKVSLWPID